MACALPSKNLKRWLAPLLRGDGSVVEGVEVALCVRQEVVKAADGAFEVEEEVGALLVGDGAESVIRVLTVFEGGDQTLEAGSGCELLESILEGLGTDDVGEASVSGTLFGPWTSWSKRRSR